MTELKGKAISPGYAKGTAFIYRPRLSYEIPRYEISKVKVAEELRRFSEAVDRAYSELRQLENRVSTELGETQSAIFAAHLGLLKDRAFTERIKDCVQRDLVNAEQALDIEVGNLCQMLASVENMYIRERAQDIRDIGSRVMRNLAGTKVGHYVDLPSGSVIIAHELLPSETLDLDREHVVGIVTEAGGENSHAAILARALGIAAVTGIDGATSQVPAGSVVLVDGESGTVYVMPSGAAIADFSTRKSSYDRHAATAIAAEGLDCATKDGTRVSLFANINRPRESSQVAEHRLDGVGLFRTEFMFLEAKDPPCFDRQVAIYREVIESVANHPVVIRTLDLGGDKDPAFLTSRYEANPNLGSRGLRFCLEERDLFETQVRAIITATQGRDNVRLLLPMVIGGSDLTDAVKFVQQIAAKLNTRRVPQIGAMIETPAALFSLEEIFQIADFVCIGTNDLTQFMLAADRNAYELADGYSVLHPSVLRAISSVVEAGRKANREVCVCGEAASYPRTACLFVGLGIRQLSMSPIRAARVRYLLREVRIEMLQELADRALQLNSVGGVQQLLESLPAHPGMKPGRQFVAT